MIAASAVGIFVIPLLYAVFQRMRERVGAGEEVKVSGGALPLAPPGPEAPDPR